MFVSIRERPDQRSNRQTNNGVREIEISIYQRAQISILANARFFLNDECG